MSRAVNIFAMSALVACTFLATPDPTRAEECAAQTFGSVTVDIKGRELVAQKAGKTMARYELTVVGSAWKCFAIRAFPEKRLLFVEWNGGQAGTRSIFQKVSLLAFSITPEGIAPRGEWVLRQGYHGDGPARIEADRTWRLEERNWGVDVVLSGTRRIAIEPK